MPRYDYDPSKVSASIEVFPKGEYEFIVGEPKAFAGNGQKGPNYGVRYVLTCASDGPMNGKKFFQSLWFHSEAAGPINKRFMLAASGYNADKNSEQRYNTEAAGKDWSFDTDSGAVGDGYRELVGKRVVADVDVTLGDNGNEQQKVNAWRPL